MSLPKALLITLFAFLFGYIFNALGHFIEAVIGRSLIQKRIELNLNDPTKGGWLIKKCRFLSVVGAHGVYSKKYPDASRNWSKEESKFARTLLVTDFFLLIYALFLQGYQDSDETKKWFYIQLTLIILLVVAFYRYMISSFEYIYKSNHRITD